MSAPLAGAIPAPDPVPMARDPAAFRSGPALRYGVTTGIAAIVALYLAILFELDQPYWAATTALIVAQPQPGQVVGKGFWRAVGTITGSVAGAALVTAFGQMPGSFVVALAAWIAATTGLATLLRGFRSYGAVLSGYTAAIVALSAIAAPDRTFDIAIARASAILLGILCSATASALLIPSRSREDLLRLAAGAIRDMAAVIGGVASGASLRAERRRVIADLAAIERLGPAAAAEHLPTGRRIAGLEALVSELLAVASALRTVDEHLVRLSPEARTALLDASAPALERARAAADRAAAAVGGGPVPATAGPRGEEPGLEPEDPAAPLAIGRRILADRLDEARLHLGRAVSARAYLFGETDARPRARLAFHRDTRQAGRNALRAFLAVGLAGLFAIESAWSAGGTFLTNVGVASSLFATMPRPSTAAFGFMRGAALAIAASFAVKFHWLPLFEGFDLLAMTIFPVIVLATFATTLPGWLGTATAFNVIFLSNLAPTNAMSYDPVAFLDGALGTLVAFAVGGTVFRVVLPADPAAHARRLAGRLKADVAALATGRVRDPDRLRSLMYDRVGAIVAEGAPPAIVTGSISLLGVAADVTRLRSLALPDEAGGGIGRMLATLAEWRSREAVRAACEEAIAQLAGLPRDESGREAVEAALAALTSIRDAVAEGPDVAAGEKEP